MNREEFISYIKDPTRLDKTSLSEINELLEEFPYFQSGHLLFLKNLHNLDHIRFAGQLKKSAAFVANREVLYRLLFDNNDPQVEKKVEEHLIHSEQQPIPEKEKEILQEDKQENFDLNSTDKKIEEIADKKETEPSDEKEIVAETTNKIEDGPRSKEDLAAELKKRLQEIQESSKKEANEENQSETQNEEDILQLSEEQAIDDKGLKDKPEIDLTLSTEEEPGDLLDLEMQEKDVPTADTPSLSEDDKNDEAGKEAEKKNLNSNSNHFETHPFSAWLNLLNTSDSNASNKVAEKPKNIKQRQLNIIDQFIQNNPRITPHQEKPLLSDDISMESVEEKDEMFTETLARIYIKQGYYSKALFIYKKLSLKFPEKSSYFAGQIKKIEDRINEL